MEKFDEFDEQPAIRQSFPTKLFSHIVSSMEHTINLSKFCLSKVYVGFFTNVLPHQTFTLYGT